MSDQRTVEVTIEVDAAPVVRPLHRVHQQLIGIVVRQNIRRSRRIRAARSAAAAAPSRLEENPEP